MQLQLSLPIYWTKHFKTKPPKTVLLGMNWFRNAFHFDQNAAKQDYSELVANQLPTPVPAFTTFTVHYDLYYKSPASDASNTIALIEKFTLDALKTANIITDDNVKYHLGSSYSVIAQDKDNPRVIITIQEASQ